MRVIIACQKKFGLEVLKLCERYMFDIKAVITPFTDNVVRPYALQKGYTIVSDTELLSLDELEFVFDLGITAHFFKRIPEDLRLAPKIGWLGYHPSLLPRHRGKSAIEWALRMKDCITGGTLYWLSENMDEGEIAHQDWIFLDHTQTAKKIWDQQLFPMGIKLFDKAFCRLWNAQDRGPVTPQNLLEKFATTEPGIDEVVQG